MVYYIRKIKNAQQTELFSESDLININRAKESICKFTEEQIKLCTECNEEDISSYKSIIENIETVNPQVLLIVQQILDKMHENKEIFAVKDNISPEYLFTFNTELKEYTLQCYFNTFSVYIDMFIYDKEEIEKIEKDSTIEPYIKVMLVVENNITSLKFWKELILGADYTRSQTLSVLNNTLENIIRTNYSSIHDPELSAYVAEIKEFQNNKDKQ